MRNLGNEARAARTLAVLDEAALAFNRLGVAATTFSVLADNLGLTRAALYNYCNDRVDLLCQCYLRTCDLAEADLRRGGQGAGPGLNQVLGYLNATLDSTHVPVAVISEIGFLSKTQQTAVKRAQKRNLDLLAKMIAGGIDDGSLAADDVDLAAQAMFGMLSWVSLGRQWTANADAALADRLASVVPKLILDGLATDAAQIADTDLDVRELYAAVALAQSDASLVERMTTAGSRLFNIYGVEGVSVDEIAAEVGLTKGAFYYHFESKAAFVYACYERAFELYELIMDRAERAGSGLEAVQIGFELNAQAQIADIHPLGLTTGLEAIPETERRKLTDRTNRLARRASAIASRGIEDGSLRAVDIEAAPLALTGVYSYLPKWLPASERSRARPIAKALAKFVLTGLRRRLP